MRAVDIITNKRDRQVLSDDEIAFFIRGIVNGSIADYQTTALLMAIFLNGLEYGELAALTAAMMRSGEQYDLSSVPGVAVDKHSTGGVGDKISLVLAPLVASAGGHVPMVAGRGLGHTGGTIDKLESIPGPPGASSGFNPFLNGDRFVRQVADIGCAIIGQTNAFVPADKTLYSLRDVTGTVESIPLIAASILSKKFASGGAAFVMDVKVGSGAFMETRERAEELARTMAQLGREMERPVVCLLTDMSQPLGWWTGNCAEVMESVETLQGNGPKDVEELTLTLGAWMLRLSDIEPDLDRGRATLERNLRNGRGLEVFARMVEAQGGDPAIAEAPERMAPAPDRRDVAASEGGYLTACDTRAVGVASVLLGGGREKAADAIDPTVAIRTHGRIGDRVEPGQPLFTVRYRDAARWEAARAVLEKAWTVSPAPPESAPPLIQGVIED